MHKYKRSDRVGDLVAQEVASMLLQGEIKDPKIGFVTITRVKMSPDMKHARIYFSVMGDEKSVRKSGHALNRARGFIRRALAKKVQLKYIPEIFFEFDDSLEYSMRIEELLSDIEEQEEG
ncbi:Ribosome-binding factor A [hydrothermal vent metagenome]|uniref:Ribosome-binding factor A n=1 Tax=hydrothermal vent metagenome TaxID=652676 RepID=A0A3B0RD66_9ZZZZ